VNTPTPNNPRSRIRNYLLFVVEGGTFMGATHFTNHQTVLPSLILEQDGPAWLAALVPGIMVMGMFAAPMFTHRYVSRLQTYHGFTNFWFFFQRAVYLLAAALLFMFSKNASAVVAIIALTPLISGVFGGLPYAAWQQLFIRELPQNRRPSNLAMRFLMAGFIGIFAGKVIELTLRNYPGATGYAWLHLWASIAAMISWITFACIRETRNNIEVEIEESNPAISNQRAHQAELSWIQILLKPDLRRFWISLILMHFIQILAPFYAVGIRQHFHQDIAFLGVLAFWQMVGYTLGNISAGYLGDKFSGKWVFRYGMLFFAMTLPLGVFAPTVIIAKIGYFAFGYFLIFMVVGKDAFILESAQSKGRSLFLSLASFVSMLCMLLFSLISYYLWIRFESLPILAIPVFIMFPAAYIILSNRAGKSVFL